MAASRYAVAAGLAWASSWLLLDAAASGREATQFASPRIVDWLPFVVLAGLGASIGALDRVRIVTGLALVSLVGSAAAGIVAGDGLRLGLLALALSAIVGANARAAAGRAAASEWWMLAVVGGAGAVAVVVWPAVRGVAAAVPGLATTALAMILSVWPTSGLCPVPRQRPTYGRGVAAVAVVALSWLAAPPELWAGAGAAAVAVYAGLVNAAVWAWLGARSIAGAGFAAAAWLCTALSPSATALDPARYRVLASGRLGVAAYERATQAMVCFVDGVVAAAASVEHPAPELAATLVRCLWRPGDRVLVLGRGTGRLPALLLAGGAHEVEVVDDEAAGDAFACLGQDGPVVPPAMEPPLAGVRRKTAGWLSTVAGLPAGSRAMVVFDGVPPVAGDRLPTAAVQRALRALVGEGIVLQPVSLEHGDPRWTRALLTAAAAEHPWNGVVAVGDAAWLVSAGGPPRWPDGEAMATWPAAGRWTAHAAHLGDASDVQRALLGIVRRDAEPRGADGPGEPRGRAAMVRLLQAMLDPLPIPDAAEGRSLLQYWRARRAAVRDATAAIGALGGGAEDVARAQQIAIRFLHIGAPAASLQAALGLPDGTGSPLVPPAGAVLRAHAIDPTFFAAVPPALASLPRPVHERGSLEDLARLPPDERLVELCSGSSPLAVGLRARFASRCARALVGALAQAPLPPKSMEALRELADPFVLAAAGDALRRRGALAELIAIWRADLAMPAILEAVPDEDPATCRRVAAALGGRHDAASTRTLARFLAAPDVELRRVAAESLRRSHGDRIPYDPEWPRSALIEAADRLRSLHNRHP